MPTKPTKLPEWAVDDVVDGTSGQNNVAEPDAAKKLRGWDFQEFPNRGHWNWLHRLAYNWLNWLNGTTIPLDSSVGTTNEQLSDGTGHTHAIIGASEAEAIAGVDNEKVMTPLRAAQVIANKVHGTTNLFTSAVGVSTLDITSFSTGMYLVYIGNTTSLPATSQTQYLIWNIGTNASTSAVSRGADRAGFVLRINESVGVVTMDGLNYDAAGVASTGGYIYSIELINATAS